MASVPGSQKFVCMWGRKRILSSLKNFTLPEMTSSMIFVRTAGHQNSKDSSHKISYDLTTLSSIENKFLHGSAESKAATYVT